MRVTFGRTYRLLVTVMVIVLLVVTVAPTCAGSVRFPEYEVKAAFLLNFVDFVSWPEETEREDDRTRICMLGKDPFGGSLETLVVGRPKQQRPEIIRIDDVPGNTRCGIIFVSSSEKRMVKKILSRTRKLPVLTVSDIDGFAERGGIIGLYVRDNKVRFKVNRAAADDARLRISSKLLRLAEIVGEPELGR